MKKGGRGKGRRGKKRKRSTNEDPASSVPKNFVTNEMSLKNSLKSPEVHSPVFVETVRQLHPLKRCAYDLIALCLESGVPQNCNGDFILDVLDYLTGTNVTEANRAKRVRLDAIDQVVGARYLRSQIVDLALCRDHHRICYSLTYLHELMVTELKMFAKNHIFKFCEFYFKVCFVKLWRFK